MRNFIALEVRGAETQRARDLLGSLAVTSSGRTEFQVLGFSGWKTLTYQGSTDGSGQSQASVPSASSRAQGFPYVPHTHMFHVQTHQEEGLSVPTESRSRTLRLKQRSQNPG